MASLAIWMAAFTISICVTILSAAAGSPLVHMAFTALVTLAIAIVAVQAYRELAAIRPSRSVLAASTARYIGLVWLWAAIAVFVTYAFLISNWREWWQFAAAMFVVGCLCLALAVMFQRDADEGHDDETILKVARLMNVIQVVGMLIAAIGLVADGKFDFGATSTRPDWAANNIFFFGALAIACIGAHAIASDKKITDADARAASHS